MNAIDETKRRLMKVEINASVLCAYLLSMIAIVLFNYEWWRRVHIVLKEKGKRKAVAKLWFKLPRAKNIGALV